MSKMGKIHDLKIKTGFWKSLCCGEKTFEIRKNDRGFNKGEFIRFHVLREDEFQEAKYHEPYLWEITYVLSGWGLKSGYVALGIKPTATPVICVPEGANNE